MEPRAGVGSARSEPATFTRSLYQSIAWTSAFISFHLIQQSIFNVKSSDISNYYVVCTMILLLMLHPVISCF